MMRFFMHWIVCTTTACVMQIVTNYLLPVDLDRTMVIGVGGVVSLLWQDLIYKPIKRAFP